MATRRPRVALAVVAAALLTVACSGSSGETDHGVSSGGVAVDADARSGLAILDETIPAEDIHGDYWPKHDDLRSISCGSDVAFVGRIAGYTEALGTVPPDAEDPDWARVGGVFDGLVFAVDELLVGDLNGSAQVTVAFWALQVDEGGSPRSRITGAPFEVIRPGIEQRDNPDGPRYLVYALASKQDSPLHLAGVFWFNTSGGVTQILGDGSLDTGADRPFGREHGFTLADAQQAAQAAERLCVKPPLPPATWDAWLNGTGLSLYAGEAAWADRLDRVCKTALGADLDSPVWDRDAALALAEEFVVADGLRPDLPPQSRQQLLHAAARALWIMVVQRAGPDEPSVCWDRAPQEFLDAGPPGRAWSMPPGFDSHMTDEALALAVERSERMFWWVEPPLRPRTREIWWETTGLRATVDENVWAARLNRACNTPVEDPAWDRPKAATLAEEFIKEDGGKPSPELVTAGADALWRMTTEPQQGACPWHYPPGTFDPAFVEYMNQLRRAALN
ncbi:MAG: hypothetical protein F4010_01540 [Cenarchaeum sp. SB0669_bin_11]|nr:hypothetical protein [Cenarchaeum sp. SB0669_bin_11]